MRRTRVRGNPADLLDWLLRFKLWWDRLLELEFFPSLRDRNAPGGIVVALVSEYTAAVERHAERANLSYHQVLYGSARTQLLIEAADMARFLPAERATATELLAGTAGSIPARDTGRGRWAADPRTGYPADHRRRQGPGYQRLSG